MAINLKTEFTFKNVLIWLILSGFGILLIAILFDFFIMPFYTKHGQEYDLPDITTKPISEALAELKDAGFQPIIQDSSFDEFSKPGVVLQQNPLPFSKVKEGRRVYLSVSLGEKPIRMPSLVGLTPQDAEFRIREEGLVLNEKFYEFSDSYYKGVVIAQSIEPKERVRKNQNVDVTISLGPAPTSIKLPNVVGKSLISAEKEFEALGVKMGFIRYSYRPNLVPGTVLRQSVQAGFKVAQIDSVNLLVSTDKINETKTDSDTNETSN